MMEIQVPYGKDKKLDVNLPDENVLSVVYPNKVEEQNQTEILLKAIENPINSGSFADFLSDAKDVLFIVNDGTRPTPTAKVLEMIYEHIKDQNIKFIIATGVHRPPTQ
jgi:nickel-dependent lactate racemase